MEEGTPPRRPALDPTRTVRIEREAAERAAETRAKTAYLTVIRGSDHDLGQHLLIEDAVVLGRDEDVDFTVHDLGVSRRHARIERRSDGTCVLTDLGSTNGTLVNDARTARGDLSDGDQVQVGEVVLRFELDDDEKPKPKVRVDDGGREDFAAILRGEKEREDKPLAASIEGHAAIQIKQRILQYQKKSKKGSQLGWDLSQLSTERRWLLILIAIGGCVALFLFFMNMARGG